MKRYDMTTVVREVPFSEVPKPWRQGLRGRTVRITLEDVPQPKIDYRTEREAILAKVAGVWADRSDEEIEAWQQDLRQTRKRRFDALLSDVE